jgi:transcription-repair coupling factor (superfamily II helicase)
LVLYKRISNCKNNELLEDLRVEMIDRFGSLPLQTVYLFQVTELKLQAEALNISKIEIGAKGGRLEFHPNPRINPDAIIRLIQQKSQHFRLDGPNRLKVTMDLLDNQKRIEMVKELMDTLRIKRG